MRPSITPKTQTSSITRITRDFIGAEVVTEYAYDEINRLTREATCDFMNLYLYDDGGNRTKLAHTNAVYSKDGNGRIGRDLEKRKLGRKVPEG